jgi:hypothetical protein
MNSVSSNKADKDESHAMRLRSKITVIVGALATGIAFGLSGLADDSKPASNEPAQVSPAAMAIAKLLEVETVPGKTRLETIRPIYQQALAVAPRDARLEYAYSLVLLRIFEAAEARSHLQRSLEIDPEFVPANQAVIRELLKGRKYAEAGERLSIFGEKLDPARPESPRVAEWLGRIVGAVIVSLGTPDAQSQFAYQDRVFRTSLPPSLLASYERGFLSVERDLEQLTSSIEEARSVAAGKREAAKAQIDADLKKDQNEIKLKQQDAQKTRQKWDEWVTDQTAKADDLLREQEKRFLDLEKSVTAQQQSIAALRLAIERIERDFDSQQLQQQQLQQQRRPVQNPFGITFSSPNVDAIRVQLAVEEQRLAVLFDQQSAVTRQASQTLSARKNAVAQYQQATGIALKEASNLDRWEKRNKNIADNMKKAAEKKPTQVATLEARIKSLNTWDPSDFESEKRRLLADLGIVENEAKPTASGPGISKTSLPRP